MAYYFKGYTMKRLELVQKIRERKKQLGITVENLAKLSGVGVRTVNRLLNNEDVKLSTVEAVTTLLGLDFAGNEVVSLETLKRQRAHQKALFLASIVQSTSTLEMQGLDTEHINKIIADYEEAFLNGSYQKSLWVA